MSKNPWWSPSKPADPDVGTTADDKVVTFRTGVEGTPNEGHALIADGIKTSAEFDRPTGTHDHAGPGFYEARGAYTGAGGSDPGATTPASDEKSAG